MRFGKGAALFEPDVLSIDGDDPTDFGDKPRKKRFSFHVSRPAPHSNLRGECTGVQDTRSGTLIIFGVDGHKRIHVAAGTWSECNTEEIHGK